jgi:hypothetical protein
MKPNAPPNTVKLARELIRKEKSWKVYWFGYMGMRITGAGKATVFSKHQNALFAPLQLTLNSSAAQDHFILST